MRKCLFKMRYWFMLLILAVVILGRPEKTIADESAEGNYEINYFYDVESHLPSDMVTYAISGEKTKLLTVEELGFYKEGYVFEGWRINRSTDNKWYLRNPDGKKGWYDLVNGELPEGYQYALRGNGGVLISPTETGTIRLVGQWGGIEFTVYYHIDEDTDASGSTTTIPYGEETPLYSVNALGFAKEGKIFKGWKLYREIDGKWWMKEENGKRTWGLLEDGKLKEGYDYSLLKDEQKISKAATSGIVHAYAQWGE